MSGASDLAALRSAVVANLKANIPGVPSIEPHGGAFTAADVAAFATLTPAIRVAVMGVEAAERNNLGIVLPVNFSAVVVTRDTINPTSQTKVPRDVQGLLIANALMLNLMSNRFGFDGVYQPEKLRSINQYSEAFFTQGMALWEVTWTSKVTLVPIGGSVNQAIAALAELYINGVLFIDTPVAGQPPQPVAGADPLTDAPNLPGYQP